MTDDAIAFATIEELTRRLKAGEVTSAALVDVLLRRIAALDGRLHAFVEVYADEARQAADLADRARAAGLARGALHGIPIAVKDLLDIDGRITTGGSEAWRTRRSTVTATAVERLLAAGMIVLGKTHMVEFAFGSWGTNERMGTPRNPWDAATHRVPGGSSSGSGVAVAAGLVPAAIGSDTGGSIRIPASLCGIVGLKTTIGRISNHGVLMLSSTLDTLGPMTRSVADAAMLFTVLHGHDARDPTTSREPLVEPMRDLEAGAAGLRLAILPDGALGALDPETAAGFAAALKVYRDLGARIDVFVPPFPYVELAQRCGRLIAAEGYALHRGFIDRDDLPFDRAVRTRLRAARDTTAADLIELLAERPRAKAEMDRRLADFDALLLPTTPHPAIPVAAVDETQAPMSFFTRQVNFLDLCAIAVPCGFTAGGLPLSLQIVGRGYDEPRIFRIARAYEQATDWHRRHPHLG